MSVRPGVAERDDDGRSAGDADAVVRSLREQQERLATEVALLRQEVAALRRQLAPPPRRALAPRAAGRTARAITGRGAERLVQFGAAAASAMRIPVRRQPWVLALVLGLLMAGLAELHVFQPLEVFAAYFKGWVRGTAPAPHIAERIVIVTVDEASLAQLGPWGPRWRAHHGQLLRSLADAGAGAVGFDVYFKTPSEEFDRAFVDGIGYARARGTRVVLGAEYDAASERVVEPPPSLLAAATAIGSTYLIKDRVTNLVRYVAPFQDDRRPDLAGGVRLAPSLSAAVAMAAGKRVHDLRPLGEGVLPIDFAGGSRAFQTISYVDAYSGRFPPALFKDRQVIVGVVFRSSRDFVDTPNDSQVAGVFVHASALYTMLRGLPARLPLSQRVGLLLAAAGVTTVWCLRFQRVPRSFVILTTVAIYWAVALTLTARPEPVDLDIVPATLTMGFVWAAFAMAEKVRIRKEFWLSLGLPDDAMSRLESEPQLLAGTLVKTVTVLAVDVRNYSVFTHAHAPQHIRDIILQLHHVIERVVYQHGGYVNKFVGDGVLVVFGYPRSEDDTAMRAVTAAIELHAGLQVLREQWAREGKDGIEGLRMGINTGPVSISYQGSSKKQLDILGEDIDVATRLEDAARAVDAIALLGGRTHEFVKHRVRAPRVSVTLKHLPHVTAAYALEGWVDDVIVDDADAEVAAPRRAKAGILAVRRQAEHLNVDVGGAQS